MVAKKKAAKKVAKKPVKKTVKKVVKAVKKPVKKTVKKTVKKVVKKKAAKTVAVRVVKDSTGTVTVASVDDPGSATEGTVATVKPHLDENGVLIMVPGN